MCETVRPDGKPISSKCGKLGGTGLFGGRPELAATGLCCAEATIADRSPKRKSLRIVAGGSTDCSGFSAELGLAALNTPQAQTDSPRSSLPSRVQIGRAH